MKLFLWKTSIMSAVLVALLAGLAISQDKATSEHDSAMAVYMQYAMPGEQHKALEPLVGKWDFVSKYSQGPGSPVQESKGTSESTWILGGRYLQENVTGDMLGQIFKGISLTGYDLMKKEYLSIWMDEMSTAPMISYGQIDAAGKVMTFEGTYPDAMQNMKELKYKTVVKLVSPDQHVMEMYMVGDDGSEFKNMEITYTRAK